MVEHIYSDIIKRAPFGYAYHQVVTDDDGNPVDYLFLDANQAFEELTGLSAHEMLGKTVTQVMPDIKDSTFDWISFYGEVGLSGNVREFEQFSEPLNRWFKVQVYSPKKGFFSTIFIDITKEKNVNEELNNFFDVNLDLLCIADTDGRFIKVNKEWGRVLGYSIEEMQNHKFFDFIHPNDLEITHQAVSLLKAQNEVLNFINRYCTKDGAYRHIEWRSNPKGNLIYAAARDITNQVVKEQLMGIRVNLMDYAKDHSLEALLQKALDSICNLLDSTIGFFHFVNPDQKTISLQQWSTATKEVFCKAPGKGMHYSIDEAGVWVDCIREKKPVIHNEYNSLPHKRGLPEGHAKVERELVVPVIRKGLIVAILGVGNKVVDYTENDANLVDFVADVTWEIVEGKRKEEQLIKLSQAVEQSPASIVITDLKGRIEYVNPKFTKVTGYNLEEAIGQNPRILKSGATSREVYSQLWKTITEGKEWRGEFQNVKKNGDRYWEFATISPVINEQGLVTHYIAVKEDITERKKAEDALRRSEAKLKELNTTKDKFFSIIGHDIKGVFSSILVISDLLVQRVQEKNLDDLDQYSHMLNDVAKNGYALLENLLSWSRIQTGHIKYSPTDFLILDVIRNVVELYKLNFDEKKIAINLEVNESAIIRADRFMLETILRNLISNAIKYTNPGGHIKILTQQVEGVFRVSISDSGVGISAEDIPKLFRIETSYSTQGTNKEMGTGLGLILCKEFVTRHNGDIWVESEQGKGTTIHFTLP